MRYTFMIEPWVDMSRGRFLELPEDPKNYWWWIHLPKEDMEVSVERLKEFVTIRTGDQNPEIEIVKNLMPPK